MKNGNKAQGEVVRFRVSSDKNSYKHKFYPGQNEALKEAKEQSSQPENKDISFLLHKMEGTSDELIYECINGQCIRAVDSGVIKKL